MKKQGNNQGKVYIASMNLRGSRAKAPPGALCLNVTSAQSKTSSARLDFSPMTPIESGYKGYWNFEHYWQSGKVFEGIDHEESRKWWREQTKPHRRYPNSRGVKVLHAEFDDFPGEKLDYIPSRKKVYVPEYFDSMKNKRSTIKWKKMVNRGVDVVVYDFDGPRDANGNPICLEVTLELLTEKINDPMYPFGHGYIVAGYLAGFCPTCYVEGLDRIYILRDMGHYLAKQIYQTNNDTLNKVNSALHTFNVSKLNTIINNLVKILYFGGDPDMIPN